MNDHLQNNVAELFEETIEGCVTLLKSKGIEVILVGFFQQNEDWNLENKENTLSYNKVLEKISEKYSVYFADIYSAFERLDSSKMYKDYMGDFMHHPTSFGHQLYYLEIMPFFIKQPMSKAEIWDYIY